MDNSKEIHETLDRVRRIETRLTSYLSSIGVAINNRKPEWRKSLHYPAYLEIPHMDCSLGSCLQAIPDYIEDPIDIQDANGNYVMTITRRQR